MVNLKKIVLIVFVLFLSLFTYETVDAKQNESNKKGDFSLRFSIGAEEMKDLFMYGVSTVKAKEKEDKGVKFKIPKDKISEKAKANGIFKFETPISFNMYSEEELKNNPNLKLVSNEVAVNLITSDGKVLTAEDFEKAKKEGTEIKVYDPSEIGLGENFTLEDLKEFEESLDESQNSEVQAASLDLKDTSTRTFTYSTSTISIYEEFLSGEKRNYFAAVMEWPKSTTAGTARDFGSEGSAPGYLEDENDSIVLGWQYGPSSSSDRTGRVTYYRGSSSIRSVSLGGADEHPDSTTRDASYGFAQVREFGGLDYYMYRIRVSAYSGYYDPSLLAENGEVLFSYSHGYGSSSLNGFSLSTARSLSFSWGSSESYADITHYEVVCRDYGSATCDR
ncbi:hypothetical protein [Bacillus fonticola]|uniref:hypothetical protein n=1 Tax=Bacillus fonticola TaxID=2728853 RepID=UPI001472EB44|nr:hypothetical protein [Bacillus fonticola]